jgi:hypothetical protein
MLSFYSWDTDDAQLVAKDDVAATLQKLAGACPADQADSATRLALKAVVAVATAKDAKPRDDAAGAALIGKVLADNQAARANFDILTNYASPLASHVTLEKTPARAKLIASWMRRWPSSPGDATLSTADRLTAVTAQAQLAQVDLGKNPMPEAVQRNVREQVARADRETTDPYAREAVISTAADALEEAGLMTESDALLTRELTRSQTPYYYMLGLAANAKKVATRRPRSTGTRRLTPLPPARPRACNGARGTSVRWSNSRRRTRAASRPRRPR